MGLTRQRITARRHTWNGISLGGIMVGGAILATIATVALPAYTTSVSRVHHADATTALVRLGARQQRYYLANLRYATDIEDLGGAGTAAGGLYSLDVMKASASGFTLRASALPQALGRVEPACSVLTLDDRGRRGPAECW